MGISERTITAVIVHEFDSAREAVATCNEIEFSGFGKFIFNKPKSRVMLNKFYYKKENLEKVLADSEYRKKKRGRLEWDLKNVIADIELLQPKVERNVKEEYENRLVQNI